MAWGGGGGGGGGRSTGALRLARCPSLCLRISSGLKACWGPDDLFTADWTGAGGLSAGGDFW